MTPLPRKVLAMEALMWRSLYRWVFRRPLTSRSGASTWGYARAGTPIIWTFIVLNAIEIPALHLLLPWHVARVVLDIAGGYGLIWMLGLLASRKVYPHVLDPDGLQVRSGGTLTLPVPWTAVAGVRRHTRILSGGKALQVTGDVVSVAVLHQTNVEVSLREPTPVPLPDGSRPEVRELCFYADDPEPLVTRARAHLDATVHS
jgi:hypothetical protein